jgi:hypothetical protein
MLRTRVGWRTPNTGGQVYVPWSAVSVAVLRPPSSRTPRQVVDDGVHANASGAEGAVAAVVVVGGDGDPRGVRP